MSGRAVLISCDMEGVAGIVDWRQCTSPGTEYEMGRRLMLGEVNAAIDGCLAGGATRVVVNDAHGSVANAFANLDPSELHGRAEYCSGRHKPLSMMQGLDSSFSAVMFVGYHGAMDGPPSVLSHTYNPRVVVGAAINGVGVGESGINALCALALGVPVAMVTGDRPAVDGCKSVLPGIVEVVVKESLSRFAAQSMHPLDAVDAVRRGAEEAMQRVERRVVPLPQITMPASLSVELRHPDLAHFGAQLRGVQVSGRSSVTIEEADPLVLYQRFVALLSLTRGLAAWD